MKIEMGMFQEARHVFARNRSSAFRILSDFGLRISVLPPAFLSKWTTSFLLLEASALGNAGAVGQSMIEITRMRRTPLER
jgi:hypothetical protein